MSGTVACGGLTAAICHDFTSATAKCELHVLGLFGKMFTGTWMKRLTDILQGNIVARSLCHVWSDDGQQVVYNGNVTKLHTTSRNYVVAYLAKNEDFSDAVDYTMPIHELAADLIEGDLELC